MKKVQCSSFDTVAVAATIVVVASICCCGLSEAYKSAYSSPQVQYLSSYAYSQVKPQLFDIVNEWKYLDFEYPTFGQRQKAIANK